MKENRDSFAGDNQAQRMDFIPSKYHKKYIEEDREWLYDHPMLYRNEDFDFFFVSIYPSDKKEEELARQGFDPVPPMYNRTCKSYMKKFRNTGTQKIEEVGI